MASVRKRSPKLASLLSNAVTFIQPEEHPSVATVSQALLELNKLLEQVRRGPTRKPHRGDVARQRTSYHANSVIGTRWHCPSLAVSCRRP